ncbi:hypothetical protein HY633_00690 [Candidatus Uhrbacteria bacterium]|nr:hypothetical protein [Candidatus Uhrbacteria bacterium]
MSRMTGTINDERAALKEEIKAELQTDARRRKFRHCIGCFLLSLVVYGVPTYLVASALAKSGFVDVPVLSKRQYRAPEPVRDVIPLAGTKASDLSTILAAKAKYDPRAGTIKLAMTEVELTTLLSQALLSDESENNLPIKDVQIAIEKDFIEVFAVFERENGEAAARARFVPFATAAGKIDVEIKEIMLGSLSLPQNLARGLFTFVAKGPLDNVKNGLAEVGSIQDISLDSQGLKVELRPAARK